MSGFQQGIVLHVFSVVGTYLAPLELHPCVGYELLGIGVEGLAEGHAGPSSKKRPSFRVFFLSLLSRRCDKLGVVSFWHRCMHAVVVCERSWGGDQRPRHVGPLAFLLCVLNGSFFMVAKGEIMSNTVWHGAAYKYIQSCCGRFSVNIYEIPV